MIRFGIWFMGELGQAWLMGVINPDLYNPGTPRNNAYKPSLDPIRILNQN
jgi:hypothetical protein